MAGYESRGRKEAYLGALGVMLGVGLAGHTIDMNEKKHCILKLFRLILEKNQKNKVLMISKIDQKV